MLQHTSREALLLDTWGSQTCFRYMFTVSLYVLERDSSDEEISARFENVLVGLPHGLIHLTGVPRPDKS